MIRLRRWRRPGWVHGLSFAVLSLGGIAQSVGAQEDAAPVGETAEGVPEEPAKDVDRSLEDVARALAEDPNLSPETRKALEGLVKALQVERAASAAAAAAAAIPEATPGESGSAEAMPVVPPAGAEVPPAPGAAPPAPAAEPKGYEKVLEKLGLSGDFRLRHETNTELDDQPTQNRERIRFRLAGHYAVTDEVSVGARVATGNRLDPNSVHQTLGETFHNFTINLDRAFAKVEPECLPGLRLLAGKFDHPFWIMPVQGDVAGDLVWDGDIGPEGVAAVYSIKDVGPASQVDLVAGEYILTEQRLADEASAFVAQVSAQAEVANDLRGTAGLALYRYSDLTPDGSQGVIGDNAGNATTTGPGGLDFVSRFTIWQPTVGFLYSGFDVPVAFGAEYIRNTGADVPGDEGYGVGVNVGQLKEPGDWRAFYKYSVVEQDAVLSVVAQDDYLFQTNHRSHMFGTSYQILEKVSATLWALVSARDLTSSASPTTDSAADQWRIRLDFNFKF